MARQRRTTRPVRWLGLTAAAAIGLLAAGAGWQAIAVDADRRAFPPPGRLVDVGGHRLHLHCLGAGTPTVLLEAGATAWSSGWGWVHRELAATTRACGYDRAGLGWSEPGPEPRDGTRMADELATLLARAGIDGPYVLAGHSMGGMLARIFAARAGDQVSGLILVDPSHPDQVTRLPADAIEGYRTFFRMLTVLPAYASVGGTRVYSPLAALARGLPDRQRAESEAFYAATGHLAATVAELRQWDAISAAARATGGLGDRPLIVLTAGVGDPRLLPTIAGLHRELAALSTRGEQRTIARAEHVALITHREHALVTAAAIREVVEQVRARR